MKFSTQLFITTLSKTTHSISIFALSIILSRFFSKDEYGTYLHVQLVVNFATWAFLLGIPHSVYYFLPRVADQRRFIFNTTLIICLVALTTAVLVFFNSHFLANLLANSELINLAIIIALLVLFKVPLSLFEPLMISAQKIKEFSLAELFFNISLFITIAGCVIFDASLYRILLSTVALYALHNTILLYYIVLISIERRQLRLDGDEYNLKQLLEYSLPIGLSMGVMELSRYTDKIIVSNQTNPEDYAVYTRGAMDIPVINIVANTLDNLMMPRFVEAFKNKKEDEVLTSWHSMIRLMAVFIYPCCFFLIASASLLIPALFSDKYLGSVLIFQIYTLGLLTRISTFNVIIRAIGKTRIILWISILSIVSNTLLTLCLMDLWGLMGAPIATVITTSLMRFSYLISITYYLKVKIANVFPWRSLLHSLVASIIALIPVYLLFQIEMNVWLNLFLMGTSYSVIYIALVRINKSINPQEKKLIKNILPAKLSWIL